MPPFKFNSIKPYNQLSDEEKSKLDLVHKACNLMLENLDRVCRKYGITYYLGCGNLLGAVRHGGTIPWDDDVDIWMFPSEYDKLKAHADELGNDFQLFEAQDYYPYYVDCIPRIAYLPSHLHDDEERAKVFQGKTEHLQLDIFLITYAPHGFWKKWYIFQLLFLYGLANGHRYYVPNKNLNFFQKICSHILRFIGKMVPLSWIVNRCNRIGRNLEKHSEYPEILIFNDDLRAIFRVYYSEDFAQAIDMQYENMTVMAPVGYDRTLRIHYYGDYMQPPPPEKQLMHVAALDSITFDK